MGNDLRDAVTRTDFRALDTLIARIAAGDVEQTRAAGFPREAAPDAC